MKKGSNKGTTTVSGIKEQNRVFNFLNDFGLNVVQKTNKKEYIRSRLWNKNNRGKHDVVLYKNENRICIEVKYIGPVAGSTDEKIPFLPYEASQCDDWGDVFIIYVSGHIERENIVQKIDCAKSESERWSNDKFKIFVVTSDNELITKINSLQCLCKIA